MTDQMTERSGRMAADWSELLAIGLVAGDLGARSIARHSGAPAVEVERALAEAREAGVLVESTADGGGVIRSVDPDTALALVGALPARKVAEIHAVVGRALLVGGADRVDEAVDHIRAAAALLPAEELLPIVEHSARMCLSLGEYRAATLLFRLATDLDSVRFDETHVRHLVGLARALDGTGRAREAHELLLEACDMAIRMDAPDIAAEAVIQFVLPVDWNYSDRRAVVLLDRVQAMALDPDRRIAVDAVRALAESWVPSASSGEQQLAWVSRASLSQPMADRALRASNGASPRTRLIALLAWRWTHRGPSHLERRREISTEALDLAQTVGDTALLIESAMANAVDALESGDRAQYDRALTVARWAADHDTHPGIRWRTDTILAGAAHLDGDDDAATAIRVDAATTAALLGIAGWMAAERLGVAQEVWRRDDPSEFASIEFDVDDPELKHAAGRFALARMLFHRGDHEGAVVALRRGLRALDPETSMLFVASLATDVAVLVEDEESIMTLIDVLEPFTHSVAVDAHGWWCTGPVSLSLARLHRAMGDEARARVLVGLALATALNINDVRSIDRARALQAEIGTCEDDIVDGFGLTDRERAVLRHIIEGRTNREIAADLAYSISTIRMDTIAIYRKLEVSGRREASEKIASTGLVDLL